jgi:uncharacterized iron-regulated membrane protein
MEWFESVGHVIGVIAGIVGGIAAVCGIIYAFVRWILRQNKQSTDIEALRQHHEEDQAKLKEELCVITYALFAALDGLKQQGCNGAVTSAHTMLQKHINKSAHDQ